ncbi:MFS general substrate transporter [Pluteus cervinus]|uniref:MFS general substrate transporter n=1 Tax=Pluteus cervinus TaxID=181527 RepID=A0ACD3BB14_9AGAR|nr:MFS general substrate transporter [Pluteus cervinus]
MPPPSPPVFYPPSRPTSMQYEEDDSLLHPDAQEDRRGKWKAHPFWLIPVALVMSISRGITMAPRVQTYNDIACRVLNNPSTQSILRHVVDCKSPEVQGRAARIQATIVTIMSVLSAVVTGPWSRLGDAKGRKVVLSLALFGALSMDFAFILVSNDNSFFGRHAEAFILVGPILDGLVGGLSTFNGVVHAYISDCTRHGSRSRIFSTIQGMVFVGLALGPWVSGVILASNPDNTSRYYLSAAFLTSIFFYVLILCPESLHPSVNDRVEDGQPSDRIKQFSKQLAAALMSPVLMFAPRKVIGHPTRKNYNMTLVGLGMFLYLVSTGVYANKYLYAQHIYEWSTDQLGHYLSLLWITRAFNLLVFLPIVIGYFRPKVSGPDRTSLSADAIAADMRFDNYLARASLAVDGLADFLIASTPTTSEASFVALSCLSSMTSGGNPALHSLGAVCLHACGYSSEVGTLFGAIAVLSAAAHIVSPTLYATTYSKTVGTYPQAIFLLASILLATSVSFLSGISSKVEAVQPAPTPEEEERLLTEEQNERVVV